MAIADEFFTFDLIEIREKKPAKFTLNFEVKIALYFTNREGKTFLIVLLRNGKKVS